MKPARRDIRIDYPPDPERICPQCLAPVDAITLLNACVTSTPTKRGVRSFSVEVDVALVYEHIRLEPCGHTYNRQMVRVHETAYRFEGGPRDGSTSVNLTPWPPPDTIESATGHEGGQYVLASRSVLPDDIGPHVIRGAVYTYEADIQEAAG